MKHAFMDTLLTAGSGGATQERPKKIIKSIVFNTIFKGHTIRPHCQHTGNQEERSFKGKIWQLPEFHTNYRCEDFNKAHFYTKMS